MDCATNALGTKPSNDHPEDKIYSLMDDQGSSLPRVFYNTMGSLDATLSHTTNKFRRYFRQIVASLELRSTGTQIMIGITVKKIA